MLKPKKIVLLNGRKVKVKRTIAEGSSGYVYEVKDRKGGQRFALKQVIVGDDEEKLLLCERELDIMRRLKGAPNIVQLEDSYLKPSKKKKPQQMLILMELCPGGGLRQLLGDTSAGGSSGKVLAEDTIVRLLRDIGKGLARMHGCKPAIIHRDLKVENILLSSEGSAKLCDFGSAALAPPDTTGAPTSADVLRLADEVGRFSTAAYRAPEMVDVHHYKRLDAKVDSWALGCVLYMMMFGALPFGSNGMSVLKGEYYLPPKHTHSHRLLRLLANLLEVRPSVRPTVAEALSHFEADNGLRAMPAPLRRAEERAPGLAQMRRASSNGGAGGADAAELSSLHTLRVSPAELQNWPPTQPPPGSSAHENGDARGTWRRSSRGGGGRPSEASGLRAAAGADSNFFAKARSASASASAGSAQHWRRDPASDASDAPRTPFGASSVNSVGSSFDGTNPFSNTATASCQSQGPGSIESVLVHPTPPSSLETNAFEIAQQRVMVTFTGSTLPFAERVIASTGIPNRMASAPSPSPPSSAECNGASFHAALGSLASQQQGRVGGHGHGSSGSSSSNPFDEKPIGSLEVFQFNTVEAKQESFEFFGFSACATDFGRQ